MKSQSKIISMVHEDVKGLHRIGLMDEVTMREFDALCLPPVETYSARQIKQLRTQAKVSQAVFAVFLNTSKPTVQK